MSVPSRAGRDSVGSVSSSVGGPRPREAPGRGGEATVWSQSFRPTSSRHQPLPGLLSATPVCRVQSRVDVGLPRVHARPVATALHTTGPRRKQGAVCIWAAALLTAVFGERGKRPSVHPPTAPTSGSQSLEGVVRGPGRAPTGSPRKPPITLCS